MLDSEVINMEDETDSDVQVFMNNAEDLRKYIDSPIYSLAQGNDKTIKDLSSYLQSL